VKSIEMRIHFEELGNKNAQTLVFNHGEGVSSWVWKKQVEYFSNYHCLLPDLPEHGKSINERPFSIKTVHVNLLNLSRGMLMEEKFTWLSIL
jgi:pimeloyl-ACP methyl ester carboxylesterase